LYYSIRRGTGLFWRNTALPIHQFAETLLQIMIRIIVSVCVISQLSFCSSGSSQKQVQACIPPGKKVCWQIDNTLVWCRDDWYYYPWRSIGFISYVGQSCSDLGYTLKCPGIAASGPESNLLGVDNHWEISGEKCTYIPRSCEGCQGDN
jgi:hypothetical protein